MMKSIAVLLAGLQLVAAAAIPAEANVDTTDSAGAELSGLWETLYADKPPGKAVQEQGVPAGVFLEEYINKKTAATPGMY
jgi:hypothetical protein